MKPGFTYIVANVKRTVFYTGVTNNIWRRIIEHFNGCGGRFTSKYKCTDLVYYEEYWHIVAAIQREKEIKNRPRQWKIDLIRGKNPDMLDLAADWKKEYLDSLKSLPT